jgi:radical SAM protein with 4Fe4S-binding SPASM domain
MTSFVSHGDFSDFHFWGKMVDHRIPLDFYLEVTARCNNDCRHCYINLPADDFQVKQDELSLEEICDIADQAIELGSLWCLITGGEPLLRKDFSQIYLALKKKGLMVSLFTNACLISNDHIALLQKYPPQYIEVSVYGITKDTYERVTRRPGSYKAFRKGLNLLLNSGLNVKLKAMALHSNIHELPEIASFCRNQTKGTFRFDPLLHLRHDQNPERNEEIRQERLTPAEIVALEQNDERRSKALIGNCDHYIFPDSRHYQCDHLFHCGVGNASFTVSYNGIFRLCADLWHSDCIYDLRKGSLADAWFSLVPKVREMHGSNPEFLAECQNCQIVNLCFSCPAHAHLETGELDAVVPYFCQVAHARAEAIQKSLLNKNED